MSTSTFVKLFLWSLAANSCTGFSFLSQQLASTAIRPGSYGNCPGHSIRASTSSLSSTVGTPSTLRSSNLQSLNMRTGGHAEGFKFLPIFRGSRKYHFPRIVQIAGVYPGLAPEDVLAPSSNEAAPVGTWAYEFSDPSGPQLGTVAIPGSDACTECIDPVVLISNNIALGVQMPEEVEILILVDRGDRKFNPDKFFLWRTPENNVQVMWSDTMEPGYDILGTVALVLSPFVASMAKASSGFSEFDDDEED